MAQSAIPTAPHQHSELERIFGIFWEPRGVFEELVSRPRWWAPLIITTILSVAYILAFSYRVGWARFLEREFMTNPRLHQLSLEQQSQLVAQQQRIVAVTSTVAAAVAPAVSLLLLAAVLTFVFRASAGADLRFRQAFSVTCYAWLPWALYQILALIVLFATDPDEFDLRNPIALNVGWFLDPLATSRWWYSLASSIDLFSFWVMGLLALGYSVAARKLSLGRAWLTIAILWAVFILGRATLAALF